MSDDWRFRPESFSGQARLFPLPDLVMFPHIMQPIHVFEPRYRSLVEDSLSDDRLIAMAVLKPGWEEDYEGRPPIHEIACLTRVATHQPLDDGKYNLLLLGVRRLRVVREMDRDELYRVAQASLIEDVEPDSQKMADALRRKLIERFRRRLPQLAQGSTQLEELLQRDLPLGVLTDLVAFAMDVGLETKIELLGEANVQRRAEMLLDRMSSSTVTVRRGDFPPTFSAN
jgi:uncharacterized protein